MDDQEYVEMTQNQIDKYKALVQDKLKPQLKLLLQKRDKLLSKAEDYRSLLKLHSFEKVNVDDQLQFQINAGAKTFIHTQAINKNKIIVTFGLGVYIEVFYSELEVIIPKIQEYLSVKEQEVNNEICKVQQDLREVQRALQQVSNNK